MYYLKITSRVPDGDHYPAAIANSVHMYMGRDRNRMFPLNNNYGIVFPKAEIASDNTIQERGVINLQLFTKEENCNTKFLISGDYADKECKSASGKKYAWTTEDFLTFSDLGTDADTDGWEQLPDNTADISDEMGREIIDKWGMLTATRALLPVNPTVSSLEDIDHIRATVEYSDGSTDEKAVAWNLETIPCNEAGKPLPGKYHVSGQIKQMKFEFPLTRGYADPVCFKRDGYWYFLSTNDNLNDVGLFIRRSKTVEGLFGNEATERCILPYNREKGHVQTFWAPEYHIIGGEEYILLAIGGEQWAPESHMMKLKKGGDIMSPEGWEDPVKVVRMDGSSLSGKAITLDMTHFVAGGKDYVAWSYRKHIATPLDSGSMIMIATIDPAKPWKLTSEPVLLSRPLFGWENTTGTINNEGPYALIHGGKVYLAYSGGSANGYSYVVGYLIGDENADLLDPSNWTKHPCPALSSYSVGVDGPGHNSFFVADDGKTYVAYHGQQDVRCSMIHRVHFDRHDFPVLSLAPDRDLPESMRDIGIDVVMV